MQGTVFVDGERRSEIKSIAIGLEREIGVIDEPMMRNLE
jgi:hypothetical protein